MSWWELQAIRQTQQAWERSYYALPPDACPYDGTPLDVAYTTLVGGGRQMVRHCPMGDFTYTGGRRQT